MIKNKVFAVIRSHDSPVGWIVDVIGLAAVLECNIQRAIHAYIIRSHGNRCPGHTDGSIYFMPREDSVSHRHVSAVADVNESPVGSPVFTLVDDPVLQPVSNYIGALNGYAPAVIRVF